MSLLIFEASYNAFVKLGCLTRRNVTMYACLKTDSALVDPGKRVSKQRMEFQRRQIGNYSTPVAQWVNSFGRDQVHIVQTEALVNRGEGDRVLVGLKTFLGLDPALPEAPFPYKNSRKDKISPEGWPMTKDQYLELVDLVRPDVVA